MNSKHNFKIILVVALSKNSVIGLNGELPWHISNDLKRFKNLTTGKSVLMGRKTFQSICKKIGSSLPNRDNLVLSKQNFSYVKNKNVYFFQNISEVFNWLTLNNKKSLVVAGGELIYREFLPIADVLEITHVHDEFDGDTFFPKWEKDDWNVSRESSQKDKKSGLKYNFSTYIRKVKL